jgi:two-component system NtrC family sensor kinase
MPTRRKRAGLGSLSTRLLVPLLVTIIAVLAVYAWFNVRSVEEQFTALVRTDAQRCAGLIERATHDGMLLNRKDQVQSIIENLGRDSSVAAIRIYDMGGNVAMASHPDDIGGRAALSAVPCIACHLPGESDDAGLPVSAMELARAGRDAAVPVLRHVSVIANEPDCSAAGCHRSSAEETKLGVLEVEVSMQPLEESLDRSKGRTLWAMAALMLITGVVAAGFVHLVVLRPVDRLHEGTDRIARGELETRIEVHGDHELAHLAGAFNSMAGELKSARNELADWSHKLEEKVVQKSDELQRTQRQVVHMEKMASLGKLSATVAHELNNPISSMLTYARLVERELALHPELPAETREELQGYLRFLQQECSRCGGIVQNLLLFARRTGDGALAPTDLNEVVERSLMLVRHHLEMSDVHLYCEMLKGDPTILADAGQIEQALVALMVNAVEAMTAEGHRGGELDLLLTGDAHSVSVEVRDTGVGIPPEVQSRIFEPFFSTKNAESGVGLGLAVVYGIVQRHGGTIEVDSTPGRGTTFRLRLPRRPDPRRAAAEGGEDVDDAPGTPPGRRNQP